MDTAAGRKGSTVTLHAVQTGQAHVSSAAAPLVLRLLPAPPGNLPPGGYSNAQVDDYSARRPFAFTHRPRAGVPLRLTVRARAEGTLVGTAGFGFWSHPFAPGERALRLPRAVWFFFGAPPNDLRLAAGVPGHGWKCATLDAARWQFLALAPTAPVGVLLMRVPTLYRLLWGTAQRALGVSEHWLGEVIPAEPHTYTLDWRADGAAFAIDGRTVHETPYAPRGALGFVAWVDNQYAVVTPQGRFGFGVVPVAREHALVIEQLSIG